MREQHCQVLSLPSHRSGVVESLSGGVEPLSGGVGPLCLIPIPLFLYTFVYLCTDQLQNSSQNKASFDCLGKVIFLN